VHGGITCTAAGIAYDTRALRADPCHAITRTTDGAVVAWLGDRALYRFDNISDAACIPRVLALAPPPFAVVCVQDGRQASV
jgi:hypothetical protein